jgi:hypothetical protein
MGEFLVLQQVHEEGFHASQVLSRLEQPAGQRIQGQGEIRVAMEVLGVVADALIAPRAAGVRPLEGVQGRAIRLRQRMTHPLGVVVHPANGDAPLVHVALRVDRPGHDVFRALDVEPVEVGP